MEDVKKYVIDTNSLINNPYIMEEYNVVLTSLVLREIEKLELKKSDGVLQLGIRVAKRLVESKYNDGTLEIVDVDDFGSLDGYDTDYVDNRIIYYALENNYGIISDDRLLIFKATGLGIDIARSVEPKEKRIDYKGFKEVLVSKEERNEVYSNLGNNHFDLLINQYVLIRNEENDEMIDVLVWTGKWMESIFRGGKTNLHLSSTRQFDRVDAKDPYQAMVIDSFRRNQVTMVRGRAGSGKSLLSLYYAWEMVDKDDGRLVVFFNPAPSKDSITMGFNKGDLVEKAMQSSLGSMLKSKFGDEYVVKDYIADGKLEILPFTDLRGWDSKSSRKTCVLFSESQNLTAELMKLGLQRIDDNTQVIIDGDYNQQVDKESYLYSNGMKRASEILRGQEIYGEVELQNVYRSYLAELVDEM